MTLRAAPGRGGLAAIIDHPADAMSCGTQVGTEEWSLRSNKGIIALRQAGYQIPGPLTTNLCALAGSLSMSRSGSVPVSGEV